jgi:hypothetical protein
MQKMSTGHKGEHNPMSTSQTMYEQNVYFPDVFKGCLHNCVYCKPSFQRQAKRQKQRCQKCYTFEPHLHAERLNRKAPATYSNQFVFFPKGGDLCFADYWTVKKLLKYMRANPQTTFMSQSKDPEFWHKHEQKVELPKNLILGVTLETNKDDFYNRDVTSKIYSTPSQYSFYSHISKAQSPRDRYDSFRKICHSRKAVTIEPILKFDLERMIAWVEAIKPEFVYVGYDTKKCKLPEPTLTETQALIGHLKDGGFDVRLKTIRKAWYESGLLDCEKEGQDKL